jgi:hypothetical protein
MKTRIIAKVVLCVGLFTCATALINDLQSLGSAIDSERRLAEKNDDMLVTFASGVDVWGRIASEELPSGVTRVAVFVLRSSTIQDDIETWSRVAESLTAEHAVQVVGYCDSMRCAEFVRRSSPPPPFAVIEYGQAGSAQAVVNADAKGEFALLDGRAIELRRIQWRRPALAAADIVKEVLK